MLFEIEKPKLLYFKQHFDTKEIILQKSMRTSTLLQQNTADHFPPLKEVRSVTSFLYCTFVILRMKTISFLFEKKKVLLF